MQNLLKFRYFLLVLLIISCKDTPKKEAVGEPAKTTDAITKAAGSSEEKIILFFGNSLTAGYGLDTEEAFPPSSKTDWIP